MNEAPQAAPQSLLLWIVDNFGRANSIVAIIVTLISFSLVLLLVFRGKGPMGVAALVLIVPAPFLVGLYSAVEGGVLSFHTLSLGRENASSKHLAEAFVGIFVGPLMGLRLMAPGYLVAVLGTTVRAFLKED